MGAKGENLGKKKRAVDHCGRLPAGVVPEMGLFFCALVAFVHSFDDGLCEVERRIGIEDVVALFGDDHRVAHLFIVVFEEGLQAVAQRVVELLLFSCHALLQLFFEFCAFLLQFLDAELSGFGLFARGKGAVLHLLLEVGVGFLHLCHFCGYLRLVLLAFGFEHRFVFGAELVLREQGVYFHVGDGGLLLLLGGSCGLGFGAARMGGAVFFLASRQARQNHQCCHEEEGKRCLHTQVVRRYYRVMFECQIEVVQC